MLERLKCWNNHFSSNNFCHWAPYTDRKHWPKRKLQKKSQSSRTGFIILKNLQRSKKYFHISMTFSPFLQASSLLLPFWPSLFCPLPLVSFSSGQLWPHLLPAWRGVSSNRQPTCTTASRDTLLKTERTAGGTERNFKDLKLRCKYADTEGFL